MPIKKWRIGILISLFFLSSSSYSSSYLTLKDIQHLPSMPATQRLWYGKNALQFGDLRLPSKGHQPFPVVVLIHGGCWLSQFNLTLMDSLATALSNDGIATWNIEYRPVDKPEGGWPGTFQDVHQAINYLTVIAPHHHLNLQQVILLGHSAGGHLALWAAKQPSAVKIRGVIDLAGPGSLESFYSLQSHSCGEKVITAMMGGTPEEKATLYRKASPIDLLPLGVKQIVIVGDEDSIVPPRLAEEYTAAAQKAGDTVQLITLKHTSHFEIISPQSDAWLTVKKSIENLLKPQHTQE